MVFGSSVRADLVAYETVIFISCGAEVQRGS